MRLIRPNNVMHRMSILAMVTALAFIAIILIGQSTTDAQGESSGFIYSWDEYMIDSELQHGETIISGDMDNDGNIDVVVSSNGRICWYEAPYDPSGSWIRHIIDGDDGGAGMDVVDMDRDGDLDVVAALKCKNSWAHSQIGGK